MSTTQHVDVCSSQRRSISRVKAGAVAGEGRGGAGPPASPLLRLLCCSSAVLLLGGAAASAAPNNCRINQPTYHVFAADVTCFANAAAAASTVSGMFEATYQHHHS